MKINNNVLLGMMLVIGIGIGMLHAFLLPPFQAPDEVQHFLYSASYAYDTRQMEIVENEVLELLKEYNWFHFVGIGPGWEKIRTIGEISFIFHFDPDRKTARKTFFHFLYGTVLKITGITDVLTAFYVLRLLSTFFYLVILGLAYWFFRRYFPAEGVYFFIGLVLVFQLATILNAVNYDVFMVLFGTLFFIFAYLYLQTQKKIYIALLLFAATMGTLTKLVGILFFLFLFILLCMKVKWDLKLLRNFLVVVLVVMVGFCWLNYIFPGRFFTLYQVIGGMLQDSGGTAGSSGGKILRWGLFDSMADSFYFHTGWMGFKLKAAWYWGLKIFLLLSAAGLFAGFFITKLKPADDRKKWLIYSLLVFVLQAFAIWYYYGSRATVQGRYLYPLVIPIIYLIYTGLHVIEKWFCLSKNYILIFYILFQVVMGLYALMRVISVFYLEIASPHSGL